MNKKQSELTIRKSTKVKLAILGFKMQFFYYNLATLMNIKSWMQASQSIKNDDSNPFVYQGQWWGKGILWHIFKKHGSFSRPQLSKVFSSQQSVWRDHTLDFELWGTEMQKDGSFSRPKTKECYCTMFDIIQNKSSEIYSG